MDRANKEIARSSAEDPQRAGKLVKERELIERAWLASSSTAQAEGEECRVARCPRRTHGHGGSRSFERNVVAAGFGDI